MTVNEATLTELVTLARQRGSISLEDLRRALPIDDMTIEDISDVLARLDEAGFDLEIDPALLSSTRPAAPRDATTVSESEQPRLPELGRQPPSSPTSTGDPIINKHTARRSNAIASASMVPWLLAFVIVLVAVFAAFAF